MASKITVVVEDDLDGGPAEETVEFSIGSATYEIDLSSEHADELRAVMEPYVNAARMVRALNKRGRTVGIRSVGRTRADKEQSHAIREWANEHGMAVSERGRIPIDVLAAYHDAQHQPAAPDLTLVPPAEPEQSAEQRAPRRRAASAKSDSAAPNRSSRASAAKPDAEPKSRSRSRPA
jgi:hypothetical protein